MLQRVLWIALALILVVTAVSVPASAANREHQQLMADLRILQAETQRLARSLQELAEAIKGVSARLDEQASATRKAFADQRLLVDGVSADVRVVREKIDDSSVRLNSLSQDVEALRQTILQMPAPAAGVEAGAAAGQPAGPPTGAAGLGVSPQRLFDTAWADYTVGQYSLAVTGFETYVKAFPKLEQASEAQWYIGEALFAQGKYKEAVTAYERVIAEYPGSKRAPDSYFKRGVALNALGEVDKARESWEFVVKTYPTTDAGRLARQRLDALIRK